MPVRTDHLTTQGPDGPATWRLTTLGATAGLKALTHLIGMIGGGVGAIVSGTTTTTGVAGEEKDALDVEIAGDGIARALASISEKISQPSTVDFVKSLLVGLVKDDKPLQSFDVEFAGNYKVLLIDLLPWALRLNFGDFFSENGGAPALLAGLMARVPTSAGSSGASGAS